MDDEPENGGRFKRFVLRIKVHFPYIALAMIAILAYNFRTTYWDAGTQQVEFDATKGSDTGYRFIRMAHKYTKEGLKVDYRLFMYDEVRPDGKREPTPRLPTDVPVLIVPGTMSRLSLFLPLMTKLQQDLKAKNLDYRYRFYIIQWGQEEKPWIEGLIMYRRRAFVMWMILDLQSKDPQQKKLIVIGHEAGGSSFATLVGERGWLQTHQVDTAVLLLSPVFNMPHIIDRYSYKLSKEATEEWELTCNSIHRNLAILSYTGGFRDVSSREQWSDITGVYHLPSWSLNGADSWGISEKDVLVYPPVLQSVSDFMIHHEKMTRNNNKTSARYIMKTFQEEQIRNKFDDFRMYSLDSLLAANTSEIITTDQKLINRTMDQAKIALIVKAQKYDLIFMKIQSDCVKSVSIIRQSNQISTTTRNTTTQDEMIVPIQKVMNSTFTIVINGETNCEYSAEFTLEYQNVFSRVIDELYSGRNGWYASFVASCIIHMVLVGESRFYQTIGAVVMTIYVILDLSLIWYLGWAINVPMAAGVVCAGILRLVLTMDDGNWFHGLYSDGLAMPLLNGSLIVSLVIVSFSNALGTIIYIYASAASISVVALVLSTGALLPHTLQSGSGFPNHIFTTELDPWIDRSFIIVAFIITGVEYFYVWKKYEYLTYKLTRGVIAIAVAYVFFATNWISQWAVSGIFVICLTLLRIYHRTRFVREAAKQYKKNRIQKKRDAEKEKKEKEEERKKEREEAEKLKRYNEQVANQQALLLRNAGGKVEVLQKKKKK